ncbi:hypothetical protein [Kitasatospora sp. NBC_01302]|uniref:hypothetical protein n=1 Tax=Kitasatospora sp. NBC_01302 TaxID=2903575 RepID=UPI002E0E943A|nr:hypothetical protein OG294_40735 [Kitasatospora sp. NBC_01302]
MTHNGHRNNHGQGDSAQEDLTERIRTTLRTTSISADGLPDKVARHAVNGDHGHTFLGTCALCAADVDALAEALTVLVEDELVAAGAPTAASARQTSRPSGPPRHDASAATREPDRPAGRDWREELETTRLARLAVAGLCRDLAAGADPRLPPGPGLAALVEEFDRMRAALAASWHRAADLLEATPHHPTALTGPAWYGRGWDDAVHHLRDLADGMS